MGVSEKNFEWSIESFLLVNGAKGDDFVAEERSPYGSPTTFVSPDPKKHYDRTLCLDPEALIALIALIHHFHPKGWKNLKRQSAGLARSR